MNTELKGIRKEIFAAYLTYYLKMFQKGVEENREKSVRINDRGKLKRVSSRVDLPILCPQNTNHVR
jgi:hypothetical protein